MRAFILAIIVVFAGVIASAQSAPQAREGDSVAWHVVQPGETLSAITNKYLGDSSLWPENQRLNPGVKDPNKLTPGQRLLVITARQIAARRAKVDKISKKVDKKLQQESWLSAKIGDQLIEREGLRTYESSSAELGLDDGTRLQMTENSIVFLREYKASIRKVDRSQIEVVEGGVDLAVVPKRTKDRRNVEILIGDVSARPSSGTGGAEARARRDAQSGSAAVMMYAGSSEVESVGVKVQVPKGMGTSVPQGKPPAPPEKLLPAPALGAPAAGAETRGATEFTWSVVPKAEHYIVEVCRDAACAELVARRTDIATTSSSIGSLPAGRLFWRVTARKASGLDGYPSKTRELNVARFATGRILLDPKGTADPTAMVPLPGPLVRLYADDGDGSPGESDVSKGQARADAKGQFEIGPLAAGNYWVSVDSFATWPESVWREQTWGPNGALCADGKGGTVTLSTAGPCFGGRRGGLSDSFATAASSEHIARLEVTETATLSGLDFGFSEVAVTSVADSDPPEQGSLRRFLLNAAARGGDHAMRFVPAVPPNASSGNAAWWRVELVKPLPTLAEKTTVDGKAWNAAGQPIDSNPGSLGSSEAVGVDGVALRNPDRPEFEIDGHGVVPVVFQSAGSSAIANAAIVGATQQQVVAVGALSIDNSVVGLAADGVAPASGAQIGIDATGDVTLERALVSGQSLVAIRVSSKDGQPKFLGRHLELVGCGALPALQIRSSGAVVENSYIHRCEGAPAAAGIDFQGQSVALGVICRHHNVSGSTIRGFDDGIVLRLGAMDNVIEGNVIDAPGHGIMFQHLQSFWTPKGNRISRNTYLGGGEPISLEGLPGLGFERKKLYELAVSCAGSGTSVDRGLDFMGVGTIERDGNSLHVRGTVCPDSTVEVYSRGADGIRYVGEVKGDAAGAVDGTIDVGGAAPRDLALVTIDKTGTTSRMKFGSIK